MKNIYRKPTVKTVRLNFQTLLLTVSGEELADPGLPGLSKRNRIIFIDDEEEEDNIIYVISDFLTE